MAGRSQNPSVRQVDERIAPRAILQKTNPAPNELAGVRDRGVDVYAGQWCHGCRNKHRPCELRKESRSLNQMHAYGVGCPLHRKLQANRVKSEYEAFANPQIA